jgi:hypothetical protein
MVHYDIKKNTSTIGLTVVRKWVVPLELGVASMFVLIQDQNMTRLKTSDIEVITIISMK